MTGPTTTRDMILPGLLDLPRLEATPELPSCEFWFVDEEATLGHEGARGRTCLSVETDRLDEMLFAYWNRLPSRGWTDLNGGGPSLWAVNRKRCLRVALSALPTEQPANNSWDDVEKFVIYVTVDDLKTCETSQD